MLLCQFKAFFLDRELNVVLCYYVLSDNWGLNISFRKCRSLQYS